MISRSKRLIIHFVRYGPYHIARLASTRQEFADSGWEVYGLETAQLDLIYQWEPVKHSGLDCIKTVFPGKSVEQLTRRSIFRGVHSALNSLKPDAVAIAGWGQPDALASLSWCRRNRVKSILMSETREADGERRWWKEWLKQRRVCQFDAALVGGRSHQAYLRKLGFQGPVSYGYDVVDDSFFNTEVQRWRHTQQNATHQPHPYFLASNRFIPRKNLLRLIEAFALASKSSTAHTRADLCLLGDGDQRQALEEHCEQRGLTVLQAAPWDEQASDSPTHVARVLFPGFRQIDELPRFYAHALALVHPAIAEPWGLVINEAMVAGLPILSSSNAGAAEELLDDGVNGYHFDATSTTSISLALSRFLALTPEQRQQMGQMSERLLAARCPTLSFGRGLYSLLCES